MTNRDGVNEKSRCHVNQGCKEFKASYVIMRPAAPIAIARVKWPPGTMGFTAGGRQVSVYLSVHAIATGTTPKKTTLRMKQQTTNALVISYAKWLCWVQENYMNSSRDIQLQTKDFSASQLSLFFTGPRSYLVEMFVFHQTLNLAGTVALGFGLKRTGFAVLSREEEWLD